MAREIRNRLVGEGETGATAGISATSAAIDVPNMPGRSPDMLPTIIGERLTAVVVLPPIKVHGITSFAINGSHDLQGGIF